MCGVGESAIADGFQRLAQEACMPGWLVANPKLMVSDTYTRDMLARVVYSAPDGCTRSVSERQLTASETSTKGMSAMLCSVGG